MCKEREVESIPLIPRWAVANTIFLRCIEQGEREESKELARQEIIRCGRLLDKATEALNTADDTLEKVKRELQELVSTVRKGEVQDAS